MQDFSRLAFPALSPALSVLSICSLSLLSACGPHKPNSGPDHTPPQLSIKQPAQDQTLANNETRLLITATDNRSVAKIIVYRKGPSDKDFVEIGTGIKKTTTDTYEYLDRVNVAGRYEYRVKAIDPSGNTAQQTISTVIQFSRGLSRIQATVAEYTLNRQADHAKIQPRTWSGGTGELQLKQLNTATTLATTALNNNGAFALPLPTTPAQLKDALRPATSLLAEVLGEQPTNCTETPNFKGQTAQIMLGRLYARGTTKTTSALLATNSGSYSVRGITNGSVSAARFEKTNNNDGSDDANISKSSNMTEGVLLYSDDYVGISDSAKKQLCNAPSKYTGKMEVHYSVEIGKGWHFFNISFTDRGATADPRYTLVLNNADWPETDTVFYGWGNFLKKTN